MESIQPKNSIADSYQGKESTPAKYLIVNTHNPQCAFKELQTRKQAVSTEQSEGTSTHIEEAPANQATLFSCPEESRVMSFRRVANLNSHLMVGRHTRAPDRLSFHDKAKLLYKEKLEAGTRSIPVVRSHERVQSQLVIEKEQDLTRGWALQKRKPTRRFNETPKQFLNEHFNKGQVTGKKSDPSTVAKEMRFKKNQHGQRMFTATEFLTPQQIASYFSRLASKSKGLVSTTSEDIQEEELDDTEETGALLLQTVI